MESIYLAPKNGQHNQHNSLYQTQTDELTREDKNVIYFFNNYHYRFKNKRVAEKYFMVDGVFSEELYSKFYTDPPSSFVNNRDAWERVIKTVYQEKEGIHIDEEFENYLTEEKENLIAHWGYITYEEIMELLPNWRGETILPFKTPAFHWCLDESYGTEKILIPV